MAVDTPVYVYDAEAIRSRYGELTAALSGFPHQILYSVKANSNLSILRLMRGLGAGADIVSGGELVRVLRAGFTADKVVFSGVGKTRRELTAAPGCSSSAAGRHRFRRQSRALARFLAADDASRP